MKKYGKFRKTTTGQRADYTAFCLLDYIYFKKYYKVIVIDLSQQWAISADPEAIQQIDFTGNIDRAG